MSNNEQQIESEIEAKGLNAPRVRPEDLDAEIVSEQYHVFDGSTTTVCLLTLRNGFTLVGESACASPENFDAEIGAKIARENARAKLWPLLGFRLRDSLPNNGRFPEGGIRDPSAPPVEQFARAED